MSGWFYGLFVPGSGMRFPLRKCRLCGGMRGNMSQTTEKQLKLGAHVGMSGKEMFAGSVREAISYGANTFMVYTGAPQNTRRKEISELNLEKGFRLMEENGIGEVVVHAPYIINLANSVKPETWKLGVEFLEKELERASAMHAGLLVLHPGSHVDAGAKAGIAQLIQGLNEVLTRDTKCLVALETMAGKGSEIGKSFEELAAIYDGVACSDKLRVCFDTCHVHDAGYDIVNDFDGVIGQLDRLVGRDQIAVFHINDSKNARGAAKDRHENIGKGQIGFQPLYDIVHHPDFMDIVKILETPYIPSDKNPEEKLAPYREEIAMLRGGRRQLR